MAQREFYLDEVESQKWFLEVSGLTIRTRHVFFDADGKEAGQKTASQKASDSKAVTAAVTAMVLGWLSDGFQEIGEDGEYVKSPETKAAKAVGMAKAPRLGKHVRALVEAIEKCPKRKAVARWMGPSKKLPSDAQALLEALATHAFSSLTVGDVVFREDDHTIELEDAKDLLPIAQSEGGDVFAIPSKATGATPVHRLVHDESFRREPAGDSLEDWLEECVADANDRGIDVDIDV